MRRVLVALASAALLGGVALTTVASAHEGGEDLHYVAEATSFEHSKLGDGGHQIVVNFDLFEHDHGGDGATEQQYTPQDHSGAESVGHGVATCVTANKDEGVLCTGNIMVDDGQISSQGIVHVPSHHAANAPEGKSHSVMLPITGGSGRFIGAAGEVEISHEGHKESAGSGTEPSAPSALRALGMAPADHGGGGGGGGKHGGGHHALHLIFHLQ
jgi:hypothetical protein